MPPASEDANGYFGRNELETALDLVASRIRSVKAQCEVRACTRSVRV